MEAGNPDRGSPREEGIRPGHVLWIQPGATWLNQDKPRPFALAASFRRGATLVYGSTQQTETHSGASCIGVAPHTAGVNRNGLRMHTFFYPGMLALTSAGRLPRSSGYLGKSLDALRAALRVALGIGQGSCLSSIAHAGSLRGRIVVLNAAASRMLETSLAVVLTEHAYSSQRRYEVLLPILPGPGDLEREHEPVFRALPWLAAFPQPVAAAVLPIPIILSLWYPGFVLRETEHVLDEGSLVTVDQQLCRFFSLPEAGAGE